MSEFIITFCAFIIFASVIASLTDKKDLSGYYSFAAMIMAICFFITQAPKALGSIDLEKTDGNVGEISTGNFWDSVSEIAKSQIEKDMRDLCNAEKAEIYADTDDTFIITGVHLQGVSNKMHAIEILNEKYGLEREAISFD